MSFTKLILIVLTLSMLSACLPFSLANKKSGIILTVELKTNDSNLDETANKAVRVLESRLNALGESGEVTKTLPNRLEIKVYGEPKMERLKAVLLSSSKLELMKVAGATNPSPITTYPTKEAALQSLGGVVPQNRRILPFEEYESLKEAPKWVVVENPAIVDGSELRDAMPFSRSENRGDYSISFSLNPNGAAKFGDWTAKNVGSYLAVVVNDKVKSAPFVKTRIDDQGQIDGRFTRQSAEDLALILKSGYLSATLNLVEEKTFGK